jgi:hypothetical protein
MIKTFSNFVHENATSDWEDALYNACKDFFYGGEDPSIFNEILDTAFGPEFKGEKPDKEEIKEKLIEWVKDALDQAVFTEEESEDLKDDSESEISEE